VHALHSWMSELDYSIESDVDCPNNYPNNAAFVRVTATIRGRDAIEEYVACMMYLLAATFGFENVALVTTPVLKVEAALLLFAVENVAGEHANRVWVEIETEAERVLGSFGLKEYDTLRAANIPNGGC
jgi:hypothetical protein